MNVAPSASPSPFQFLPQAGALANLARYLEAQLPPNQTSPRPELEPVNLPNSLSRDATASPPPPALVTELWERQLRLNSVCTHWLARRGQLARPVASLSDIPAVPVVAFKELELTSLNPAERTRVFHSSGTSERSPSRHFHSAETLHIYDLAAEIWFRQNLLADLDWSPIRREPASTERLSMISLTPRSSDAPHSSLAHMIDGLVGKFGRTDSHFGGRVSPEGWTVDFLGTLAALRSCESAGRPVVLFGTAFNFVHLLDELERTRNRLFLPAGSRVMETGGYKGRSRTVPKAELHDAITRQLGLSAEAIVSEYGMSELSSQAYDQVVAGKDFNGTKESTHAARRFRFPPWCHVRVVSPETGAEVSPGEPGLLQVVDLANVASTLAVQTEDIAVAHADGFSLLGRAAHAEARGCSLLSLPD